MKIRLVGAELFQSDRHDKANSLSNSANVPKSGS